MLTMNTCFVCGVPNPHENYGSFGCDEDNCPFQERLIRELGRNKLKKQTMINTKADFMIYVEKQAYEATMFKNHKTWYGNEYRQGIEFWLKCYLKGCEDTWDLLQVTDPIEKRAFTETVEVMKACEWVINNCFGEKTPDQKAQFRVAYLEGYRRREREGRDEYSEFEYNKQAVKNMSEERDRLFQENLQLKELFNTALECIKWSFKIIDNLKRDQSSMEERNEFYSKANQFVNDLNLLKTSIEQKVYKKQG